MLKMLDFVCPCADEFLFVDKSCAVKVGKHMRNVFAVEFITFYRYSSSFVDLQVSCHEARNSFQSSFFADCDFNFAKPFFSICHRHNFKTEFRWRD